MNFFLSKFEKYVSEEKKYRYIKLKNNAISKYLFLTQFIRKLRSSHSISNVYHAGVQKTGSQWIKKVFSDARIVKHTNLKVFPQHRYEWGEFHKIFPQYTFVPGLYISYDLYNEIIKPTRYKTIYVFRDPRNIVVSWYFSIKDTHLLMGKVPKYRSKLQKMNINQGLNFSIEALSTKFMDIRTWFQNRDDKNVLFIKFENLVENPKHEFSQIFNFCNLDIPNSKLTEVISDYTKEKMRTLDLKSRDDSKSHYRREKTNHKNYFKQEHYDKFHNITGNLIEIMGYDKKF